MRGRRDEHGDGSGRGISEGDQPIPRDVLPPGDIFDQQPRAGRDVVAEREDGGGGFLLRLGARLGLDGDVARAMFDQMFQDRLNRRIIPLVHLSCFRNSMEYQNGQPLSARAPARAQSPPLE